MDRREFITTTATMLAGVNGMEAWGSAGEDAAKFITVKGEISATDAGLVLPHEHLLVDFIGADQVSPGRYDAAEAFDVILPHLQHAQQLGLRTLVECTPAYLARDVLLLRRLSDASGIHILTNTGYYGAADDKFVPNHAFDETAEMLAARWIAEAKEGIDGTTVRPGFIKTAVDNGALSALDEKLLRAAVLTQRATGLTIACHTTDARAAQDVLSLLREAEVPPGRFIWVHAHAIEDAALHHAFAQAGYWVEFDGLSPESLDLHVGCVKQMKDRDHLHRVLVSHDAGWYAVGEPGGGTFRPFDILFTRFLPAIQSAGLDETEIALLIRKNPQQAFGI